MAKTIYNIIFLLIGICTVTYMVYSVGLTEIWANIRATGWWFVPILLSWLLIYLMNTMAFRQIILEPEVAATRISFLKIMQLTVTGYSINYITPVVGLGGEPYRIMELKPYVGEAKAGSSVLLYTMMHILSHIVFWLLSIFVILAVVPLGKIMLMGCVGMLLLGIFVCYWFLKIYKKGFTRTILKLFEKLPFVGKYVRRFEDKNRDVLAQVDQQIQDLYQYRRVHFYKALFWEFFARIVGCVELYFIAIALGLQMNMLDAIIVSSGSSLFSNLMFFLPLQLGAREGGLAMAVMSIGLPASAGIYMGLATRIREIIWIGIGLLWMLFARRGKGIKAS